MGVVERERKRKEEEVEEGREGREDGRKDISAGGQRCEGTGV